MDDQWNAEEANRMLRAVLTEIDASADKLSPARAEALLDEFQQDIASAFLRQDLSAVKRIAKTTGAVFARLPKRSE